MADSVVVSATSIHCMWYEHLPYTLFEPTYANPLNTCMFHVQMHSHIELTAVDCVRRQLKASFACQRTLEVST